MNQTVSDEEVRGLLAQTVRQETLSGLAEKLHIKEYRLLDMMEGKERLSRRVYRYLGLRLELRYFKVNE